ncbi:transporter [Rhodopirellula sallentina SM41]|uniref:Transporter n=2 Tax=Rhodopirellula TaxID=265488 RepID=M5TSH1_9BACT|nr:transporter [Rhodopirellula sallentina SM41]
MIGTCSSPPEQTTSLERTAKTCVPRKAPETTDDENRSTMNAPTPIPSVERSGVKRHRIPQRGLGRTRSVRRRGQRGGDLLGIKRAATATAEVAICLPVLMTLTLATIDLCSVFFLKETVSIAAYEGARRGVNRGGTNAAAIARVREVLTERGVQFGGDAVSFEDATYDDAETLEHVTLVVTVPAAGNLAAPAGLYGDLQLTARVTMRKEFENQE